MIQRIAPIISTETEQRLPPGSGVIIGMIVSGVFWACVFLLLAWVWG